MIRAHSLGGLCLALALGGCASTEQLQQSAIAHERKAAELDDRGDYAGAADERAAAEKQRAKAVRRSYSVAATPMLPPTLRGSP